MRAIEVARFGGPDVLELRDLSDPVPGPGQVLVAASACDVLFVDTMIRSGRGADYFPIRPPYVPGNGVGGTIAGLGDGVDTSWLGRRVVAHTGGAGGTGGYAELAAIDFGDCTLFPTTSTSSMPPPSSTMAPPRYVSSRRPLRRKGSGSSFSVPPEAWDCFLCNCSPAAGPMSWVRPADRRSEKSSPKPGPWQPSTTAIQIGSMRSSTPAAEAVRASCSTESEERSAGKRSD